MTVSMEARSACKMFRMMQNLDLINRAEEFDIFYIWMREVEEYAETYCKP